MYERKIIMSKIKTIATTTLGILGTIKLVELVGGGVVKISRHIKTSNAENNQCDDDTEYMEDGCTITINGLDFIMTCSACPEQYDVLKDGEMVGYVRLRFGELRCDYKDCAGEKIYTHLFDNHMLGTFINNSERMHYLNLIADKLNERLKDDNSLS